MNRVMYLVSLAAFFFTGKRQVKQFAQIFAALQDSGLPILRSLCMIRTDIKSRYMACALDAVIDDVESGALLSEALAKHPRVFDRVFVSMIRAGEAGGALETILARLVQYLEQPSKGEMALILRTLGTLIASGVPILEALSIVQGLCKHPCNVELCGNVFQTIREGGTIAEVFEECGFIPHCVLGLVDLGEETGNLDSTLIQAAMLYEQGLAK